MNLIEQCLAGLADLTLGEVVHVHPSGTESVDWALQRGACRVLASTADADRLALLQRRASPLLECRDSAVALQAGAATWLRFNVPDADGLLEPDGLRQVFPRLMQRDRTPVTSIDLHSFLLSLKVQRRAGRSNVLILELPGQTLAALQGLAADQLSAFDVLVLRLANDGLLAGMGSAAGLEAHLDEQFFRLSQDAPDPLWPVRVFRRDALAAERHALMHQVASLQAQRDDAERRAAEADDLRSRVASLQIELQRHQDALSGPLAQAFGERDAALQQAQQARSLADQLVKTRDDHARRANQLEVELKAASPARVQAEKLAQDRQTLVEQLTKARDEYARQATERQRRISQLDAELNDLTARFGLLQEELIKAEAHVELISDLLLREAAR